MMNKPATCAQFGFSAIMGLAIALASPVVSAQSYPPPPSGCPTQNWATTVLPTFNKPASTIPTAAPGTFCEFNQTTFEAFVWATTMINGVPRFLTLKTPDQLNTSPGMTTPFTAPATPKKDGVRLSLGTRVHASVAGQPEGAGAIVEADGNMLVGPNGYPIYASVHMNDNYFNTAQQNLIVTGGYTNNPNQAANFNVGAAVFKATWLRLGNGVNAPVGSYTTTASVPVLKENKDHVVVPDGDTTKLVKVALVGLHVVVRTEQHPEFLWGSFEHYQNAPMVPGAYNPDGSNPNNFTLYTKNTLYKNTNVVNLSNGALPASNQKAAFDYASQTFSNAGTSVAQLNPTGGDTSGTVTPVTVAGQAYLNKQHSNFANYVMLGTVWFQPDSYVSPSPVGCGTGPKPTLTACNAGAPQGVGSVNLANSTAETFDQMPQNAFGQKVNNCFSCHNAGAYTFQTPALPYRLIATSHVLSQGCATVYGVPNQVILAGGAVPTPFPCNIPPTPAPVQAPASNVAPHLRK
jgi:hypothetical protein